ncbi:nucleotidyltransferase domain-containing protein [archaeon]|nr:nucleotidyltransferase domain-containing protein [Nanoarchaeota archaeon]MBU4452228.1 nucleotidyltransferase domain-containing protein [Nanoarchaeota archaeon]MCG2723655.1 nucleotidyltransferase domain-containing protein [archaeon]
MKTRTKLIGLIYRNPGSHIRELSRALKAGMPTMAHHIKSLEKEKLIYKKKEGRNVKLYLNYGSNTIIPNIYAVEYARLNGLPAKVGNSIFEFIRQLSNKPLLTILFGSYAKGTYTDKSDVDLFLVFNTVDREDIESKIKLVKYKQGTEISPVYMTFSEFRQKLFNETDSFMQELKQNRIIVQGIEWWVLLENEK